MLPLPSGGERVLLPYRYQDAGLWLEVSSAGAVKRQGTFGALPQYDQDLHKSLQQEGAAKIETVQVEALEVDGRRLFFNDLPPSGAL